MGNSILKSADFMRLPLFVLNMLMHMKPGEVVGNAKNFSPLLATCTGAQGWVETSGKAEWQDFIPWPADWWKSSMMLLSWDYYSHNLWDNYYWLLSYGCYFRDGGDGDCCYYFHRNIAISNKLALAAISDHFGQQRWYKTSIETYLQNRTAC